MSNASPKSVWNIDERQTWPPQGVAEPPFGVTFVEILRSCPLRCRFSVSREQGYEPRMDFAARIGTAFHQTLESLQKNLPQSVSPTEAAAIARERFLAEVKRQEELGQSRVREKHLERESGRVSLALEAVMMEARRLAEGGYADQGGRRWTGGDRDVAPSVTVPGSEVPVTSSDGLIAGRIDRVEVDDEGVVLYDYKSALRDDVPERYERQLQLYSWLWHEETSSWPAAAVLVYPFTSRQHRIAIDEEKCQTVAQDTRELIAYFLKESRAFQLGIPGEVCQICEFRPWCRPFWAWQEAEKSHRVALERARWGLEGIISSIEKEGVRWRIHLQWREASVLLIALADRFPALSNVREGDTLRILDVTLQGQLYRPRAIVTDRTEIFKVVGHAGG